MTIFLDLDGVLVDFFTSFAERTGRPVDYLLNCGYDMAACLGMSDGEFEDFLGSLGHEFWYGLKPFPYAEDLLQFCRGLAPTRIATAPIAHGSCYHGKMLWLHDWLRHDIRDAIIIRDKHLLANGNTLLVDDNPGMVAKFRAAGGKAVLFPSPFNARKNEVGDLDTVKREILEACQ